MSEEENEAKRVGRPAGGPPDGRDCDIYERHVIHGETQQNLADAFGLSQQRIAQVAARVEAWIATHLEHPLAQRMRLRTSRRWDKIWSRAIESFDRSREDREVKKERVARKMASDEAAPLVTLSERTVRQQNGDPRYLMIAARAAEREDRMWPREQNEGQPAQATDDSRAGHNGYEHGQISHEFCYKPARFPHLPATLWDLEYLVCGVRNGTAPTKRGYPVPYRDGDGEMPVSTMFEERCAEAFRYLGFDVRKLGQGCGRVADCLAVAAVERFAVIIDAKVRRRGYTLGTDDRQFCEYATRHARELALSGIERVYFAVVGHGFRQDDLDKLAGCMTGAPIRSVAFIEAKALMRLVNDSIARRREFRLAEIDSLLFGNKIIAE